MSKISHFYVISRDEHRFFDKQNFWERTNFSWKGVSFRKKRTMNKRNGSFREMLKFSFFKNAQKIINKRFEIVRTNLKNNRFFIEWTNFPKNLFSLNERIFGTNLLNESFLVNKRFLQTHFWKTYSFFTKRTILWTNDFMNELFYWTNDFTVWSFSEKTNEIDRKWTIKKTN